MARGQFPELAKTILHFANVCCSVILFPMQLIGGLSPFSFLIVSLVETVLVFGTSYWFKR
jgi:hypothetical protein